MCCIPCHFRHRWTGCPNSATDVSILRTRGGNGKGTTMRVRGYAAGMPCWAAVSGPDPSAQHHFYRALFDWELNEGQYLLEGRVVAGQGAPQETARWIVSV